MPGLYPIVARSKLVLHRLEVRGLPLDEEKKEQFRAEAIGRLKAATADLRVLTADFHTKRVARLKAAVLVEEGAIESLWKYAPTCKAHPKYHGQTNRTKAKCEGCKKIYAESAQVRGDVATHKAVRKRGRDLLKRIGDHFNAKSDDHWRQLLFDKVIGCNLKPVARTKKRKEPRIKDEDIEKLQRRYPDNPFLARRVDIQQTKTRLATRLAVKAEDDGCVHFQYHVHRSGPGRISSGKDTEEPSKLRLAVGNAQNIQDRDRAIYRARDSYVFVGADWSQIEARVMATLAGEARMLQAWREGADIHALNGAALARALGVSCKPSEADLLTFRFAGETRTYRYAAKRMTHGWNYGMQAKLTAELFGLTFPVAQRLIDAYFKQWPALRPYQDRQVAMGARDGYLRNDFSRLYRFWNFAKSDDGSWTLADPNEAISFNPQSDVSDMCKVLLPEMDQIALSIGGLLRTTTHDSFLAEVPDCAGAVSAYIDRAKAAMEREWPELPVVKGFGVFKCPADFAVGRNWAEYHEHSERCPKPCGQLDNPEGLKKVA